MSAEDLGSIHRPVIVRAERVFPEGREEKWANHAVGDVIDVDRSEARPR